MGKDAELKKLMFHYKKTDSYRSYHVDGVHGGLTPTGKLYMEFFIERFVTPRTETFTFTKEGKLGGKPEGREALEGVIRQIEAGIVMDLGVAQALRDFIDEKITDYLNQLKKRKEKQ